MPWTALLAVTWPVVGLVGLQPRPGPVLGPDRAGRLRLAAPPHRWPLLAAAGALAYACTPNRMFQLTGHFNAVMWWAFPAALLAFEVMIERRRAGRRWGWPAAGLAAITLTVAVSGEFHLILYLTGLLAYLVAWTVVASLAGRIRVPWGPLTAVVATLGVACAYVLGVFQAVFKGRWPARTAAGSRSSSTPPARSGPWSARASAPRARGSSTSAGRWPCWPRSVWSRSWSRRRAALAYAVLAVPLVVLTYGARADIGGVHIYRFLFDHLPFLSLSGSRSADGGDRPGPGPAGGDRRGRGRGLLAGRRRALVAAAVALSPGHGGLLADYRVSRNRLEPDRADNQVVVALRAATDAAGPVLGIRSWARRSPGTRRPPI